VPPARIPAIDRMRREGFHRPALAAMPAFANPNNVSIVCGVPPKIHGVSGNFHFDQESGEDVMMVDATPMRAPTILSAFSAAGARAAAITAKDKLPKALGKDLFGIAVCAEKAAETTQEENGIRDVELPEDREGDIAVIAVKGVALGAREQDHDLLQLSGERLRSHGGMAEQVVPFITSIPITTIAEHMSRNFDLFSVLLNEAI
jgi:phosphonoacetate hydrolase